MSSLSLGTRGKIMGFSRFIEAIPNVIQLFEQIEIWAKHVGTDNLDNLVITTPKVVDGAITPAKLSLGTQAASGTFTGDGVVDREINIGFRPKYVWFIRGDTSMVFEAVDFSGTGIAGRRDSTGAWTGSVALDNEWQGISPNGFRLGHAAGGGLSNTLTKVYTWYASK